MAKHQSRSSNQRKARSPHAAKRDHTRKVIGPARRRGRDNAARDRSLKALWAMRQGDSLSKSARDNGVSARTIKRYVGPALVQDRPGGRIRATKSDRLVRY